MNAESQRVSKLELSLEARNEEIRGAFNQYNEHLNRNMENMALSLKADFCSKLQARDDKYQSIINDVHNENTRTFNTIATTFDQIQIRAEDSNHKESQVLTDLLTIANNKIAQLEANSEYLINQAAIAKTELDAF